MLKYLGAGGGVVAAGAVLSACTGVQQAQNGGHSGPFPGNPGWRFVFVNHVTTNSFFVPTRSGLADAAALLGVPEPQWTGSENGNVAQMASAMETAINSKVDGIAVALTDDHAFVELTKRALGQGIPVIAYNASAAGNYPLTYVGQDLYLSGFRMGQRIAQKITSGDILVGISQPGGNNVQPRLDGITDALKQTAPGVRVQSVNTGAEQAGELNAMTAAFTGNSAAKGIYAVDAGSTAACAKLVADRGLAGKVGAGGFDLLDDTVAGVKGGALDFTIDQSPYLQGFLSVLYLYLFRLSGTLVAPPATDTGLTFVTKENVGPYATAHSRFEGGDNKDVIGMPSAIPLPPASVPGR
ncbi:sugar ABC transporter periplasmic protein [Amycolatopsis mediterranei S699]|uniref:Periplasmic substrate-binding component of ABC-type sugar transport system n=2 Tax=Amycolatopsis mediterranei TaxID=33910 RepID=A0A0H3D9W4_AMYMU|nr:sugar ABC transporter substrate-binding protein [Amycolatopsis mediterranei]ADJ46863.1 periplasmic substrate-binding component of ABC-type sugar transport system [Amycolatopsis mediterranei U32]AEK43670.1 sugar ABC transporter periplasmic protein [Amycolatopsis mediterranei S699]AFO78574.1 sugar ABC transporter periplasmic protein [Amycolatopsis mediterranei S699]AGT85702.1 sugar ABC transporter periplasmic protein [Amycolatopsis mediterranei RB]KDO04704.1 sugar ABC transporter substrate-bi